MRKQLMIVDRVSSGTYALRRGQGGGRAEAAPGGWGGGGGGVGTCGGE